MNLFRAVLLGLLGGLALVLALPAFAQSTEGRTQLDFGTLGPGESVMLETAPGGLHCVEVETVSDFFTLTCTPTDGDPVSWDCPMQFADQDVVVCSAVTWSALATDPPAGALTESTFVAYMRWLVAAAAVLTFSGGYAMGRTL